MDSSPISVSAPPIIDVTFKQTQSGDRCIDVLVEKTRLNLSVPFFMNLGRFLMDCLPGERPTDGGVINHGYVGDLGVQVSNICRLVCVSKNYLLRGICCLFCEQIIKFSCIICRIGIP